MRGGTKFPSDDFFCWRYQVWYNSLDCATRTHFRTAPGCRDCTQGDRNLEQRRDQVENIHWPRASVGFADCPDVDPADESIPTPLPLTSTV